MKKHFEKLFSKSKKAIDWLQGPIAKGIWFSVFLLIILLINISKRLNGVSALNNIILGLCGIVTFYPFIALNLKHYLIKPPTKFLRQGTENPEQLFKKFSHRAFLYGIIVYSFFTSLIIGCCIFAFSSIFNQKINFINWGFTLFFITSALFSILYFMYHISVNNISTKVIKARVRLYAAFTGTITSD
ncbi:hypothetical protein [Bacillus sp. ISL-77]|uniref:hypothetical protein n=1 Tax=Bacillus sp. ISL-77 TaxID=2819138 RepID=UPI001BE81B0E|nr:hypothetical protein [Bacillus sp. ISL-77]MBT2740724.1 hypothetical protein [Bacillus sp. ISL-77]